MRWIHCSVFLLGSLLIVGMLSAQENAIEFTEQPQVLVTVSPAGSINSGVYQQQQLILRLRVVSKYPFDALDIKYPTVAGAEQIELAMPRTRKVTSYAGQGYVHQRSVALFPRAEGLLQIPPIHVAGLIAIGEKRQIPFADQFAGTTIPIKPKPDNYKDKWWIVSDSVDMQERWSIPLETLREGDIVTRSITLTVAGVDANRLPALEHGRTQGIAVRELDITRKTIKSSQGLTGTVTKSWSLKIEAANVVYISPVGVAYWNPSTQRRQKSAVPGHRIEPLAVDGSAIANRLMAEADKRQSTAYRLYLFFILLVLVCLVTVLVHAVSTVYTVFRDRRFVRLFMSGKSQMDIYRAWLDWSLPERFCSSEQWERLHRHVQRSVFSKIGSDSGCHSAQRYDTVRVALHHARSIRLKRLIKKYQQILIFIFGRRNVL